MYHSNWLTSVCNCFGSPPDVQFNAKLVHSGQGFGIPIKHVHEDYTGLLEAFPFIWAYLSSSERLALRACCRDSRRIHDTLVLDICICDDAVVLSEIPASRLPRHPLPVCEASTHEVATALKGFTERGCQPHLLLLCLAEGHERRRHEGSLAVLSALASSSQELSVVHLCGVPLTPHTARSLKVLVASSKTSVDVPAPKALGVTSLPVVSAPSAAPSTVILNTACSLPTPRTSMTVSPLPAPPAFPLRLHLYGYDLSRQPASAAIEMLIGGAAARLTRLELWGCVGWPSRLSSLLHNCSHLRYVTVSFRQLIPPELAAAATNKGLLHHSPAAGSASFARTSAGVATGAVVAFPPLAAAATTAGVVKAIGGLHHLRCLELRGCIINMPRRTSCERVSHSMPPRSTAASKAAMERAAVAAAAPSIQQLAAALYQLTNLTRLAIDGITSATHVLTAVAAMRVLRHLELPDAAAPAASDLGAITRAAPRLVTLTLGSVGPGSVLDSGVTVCSAIATGVPEALPLPPSLRTLRVARCRPTLRTMRSFIRTMEAREAALPSPPTRGSGAGGASTRIAFVVPGIDIDMLDVEFDALQGFSRGSDGVMRSTLLPESAEALASAIRLLALPSSSIPSAPPSPLSGGRLGADSRYSLNGYGVAGGPSFGRSGGGVAACSYGLGGVVSPGGGGGGGTGCISTTSCGLVASSSFGGGFSTSPIQPGVGRRGNGVEVGCSGDDDETECALTFGEAVTRGLTIHNAQGSLIPPSLEHQQLGPLQTLPETAAATLPEKTSASAAGAKGGQGAGDAAHMMEYGRISSSPLVGHAVWISEMRPLGLTSLELYGIGVHSGDLEALVELTTLKRLTLASGELEVDALPLLANLSLLEYLELARCTLCRHRRGGGSGLVRPSTGAGYARGSGGEGFSRISAGTGAGGGFIRDSGGAGNGEGASRVSGNAGAARLSCASTYDGDGDCRELRPSGKRALLELCVTAPSLQQIFIVRCTGIMRRVEETEGPLGAEWVRQRLLAAGPRVKDPTSPSGSANAAVATAGRPLGRRSSLGRASAASERHLTERDLGWPEIKWE